MNFIIHKVADVVAANLSKKQVQENDNLTLFPKAENIPSETTPNKKNDRRLSY